MKKYENFLGSLSVLKNADREMAKADEIYRTGVVGQFNLSFELSWKLLQAVLRLHSVSEAESGSPREILKLGFKYSFLDDEQTWLSMQRDRNTSVHIYAEEDIEKITERIFGSYIKAFEDFALKMKSKIDSAAQETAEPPQFPLE